MGGGSSAAVNCKLSYFPIAGRGEPARLAFILGNVPFEDVRIQGKDWAGLKGSTPWGSLPFIELTDGTMLGQSRAVHRFAGRAAGLYPSDDVQAALVDACIDACDDVLVAANGAGRGMELGDKLLARRQACAEGGSIFAATAKVEAHYDRHTPAGSPHLTGALSMADVAVFCYFGHAVSGFFDGVGPECLKAFPRIRAVRKAVVELPAVRQYYEAEAGKEHMKLSMGGLDVRDMYQAIVNTARAG